MKNIMFYRLFAGIMACFVSASALAYQSNFTCNPCEQDGIYKYKVRCDNGEKAEIHIDDIKSPNTLSYFSNSNTGVLYASDVSLEESIKIACGE